MIRYFPSEYDTRFQTNEWNRKNIIAEASTRRDLGRTSLFFIGDHRVNENDEQILFSILRNIFSENDELIGYVIVDVYTDAVIPELTSSSIDLEPYNNLFKMKEMEKEYSSNRNARFDSHIRIGGISVIVAYVPLADLWIGGIGNCEMSLLAPSTNSSCDIV